MERIKEYRWFIVAVAVFALGAYYLQNKDTAPQTDTMFLVVNSVEKGEVSSGIQTTGDIVAAEKLNIDVYKQTSRIEAVKVQNGSHVKAGDVLLSFEKSDALVSIQASKTVVAEAALSLENTTRSVSDPNTEIRSLENKIAGLNKTLVDNETEKAEAWETFLNNGLAIKAHKDRVSSLLSRQEPVLSGKYLGREEGSYTIEVYASAADSGFSFRVSGLEEMVDNVIFGKALALGKRGLKITFPNDTKAGDKWLVSIPDREAATFAKLEENYDRTLANFEKTKEDTLVNLENSEQQLRDLYIKNSVAYKDLSVEKAEASLAEAEQRLAKNYEVIKERDIVAPFSGTMEGMKNVVVGATPTGGSDSTINLGTLISDEFLTKFSLSATDVAKVKVGDKVKVTITSLAEQPNFAAAITQISSLPTGSGVAKYEIQALLDYDRQTSEIILREGMLADIEVVQQEKTDVLRVPVSAVKYEQGQPKVTLVDQLTAEQTAEVTRLGVLRTTKNMVATYDVEVKLGVIGQYFVEIVEGVKEGDLLVGSQLAESTTESAVNNSVFGGPPAAGGGNFNRTGGQTNVNNNFGGNDNFNR